jgi:hypothetical protein
MALQKPKPKPLRAERNGTHRIVINVRGDLWANGVQKMLEEFGEHCSFMERSLHLVLNPLYDPEEVVAYINSFDEQDCEEHFREPDRPAGARLQASLQETED